MRVKICSKRHSLFFFLKYIHCFRNQNSSKEDVIIISDDDDKIQDLESSVKGTESSGSSRMETNLPDNNNDFPDKGDRMILSFQQNKVPEIIKSKASATISFKRKAIRSYSSRKLFERYERVEYMSESDSESVSPNNGQHADQKANQCETQNKTVDERIGKHDTHQNACENDPENIWENLYGNEDSAFSDGSQCIYPDY